MDVRIHTIMFQKKKIKRGIKMNKRLYLPIAIVIMVLCIGIGCSIGYNDGYESGKRYYNQSEYFFDNTGNRIENYSFNRGYFRGWFESNYIDCTLPNINKTIKVSFYNKSDGTVYENDIVWSSVCNKLS